MSAFSAKVVQHSINQLLINTIDDAEKMLLDLPRDGDRVEIITSSSYEVGAHRGRGSRIGKTTQDVVVDTMSPSRKSDELQRKLGYPQSSTTETPSEQSRIETSSLTESTPTTNEPRPQEDGIATGQPKIEDVIKKVLPNKAEVVPGSITVSPLRQMEGVLIDLVVMIKMKSGSSRTVNMQIECPRFRPKRIRIDGVWHCIV